MTRISTVSCLVLAVIIVATLSCSATSISGDEEKVKSAFIKSRSIKSEFISFSEIKLLRDVTVEDSINIFLQGADDIIKAHDESLRKLKEWISLKEQEANSYSEWNHDSYIQKFTDEVNKFADSYSGDFSDEPWAYDYTYRNLYRLRQMDRNKVLGKIYSITYTLNKKTQTQIWCFDAEVTETIGSVLDEERSKKPEPGDIERIHFQRVDETSKEEELPEATFIKEGGEIIEETSE